MSSFAQSTLGDVETGIVHQDVEPAERRDELADRFHLVLPHEIGGLHMRGATCLADSRGNASPTARGGDRRE